MSGLITQQELCTALSKKIDDSDSNSKLSKQQIGVLASLRTNSKDSLVNAINELYNNTINGKKLIADAITNKGVNASNVDTYQVLANKINNIKVGYTKEEIQSEGISLSFKLNKIDDIEIYNEFNKYPGYSLYSAYLNTKNPDRVALICQELNGLHVDSDKFGYKTWIEIDLKNNNIIKTVNHVGGPAHTLPLDEFNSNWKRIDYLNSKFGNFIVTGNLSNNMPYVNLKLEKNNATYLLLNILHNMWVVQNNGNNLTVIINSCENDPDGGYSPRITGLHKITFEIVPEFIDVNGNVIG